MKDARPQKNAANIRREHEEIWPNIIPKQRSTVDEYTMPPRLPYMPHPKNMPLYQMDIMLINKYKYI